jgi:exodeoxyribonuclease VII small subunit
MVTACGSALQIRDSQELLMSGAGQPASSNDVATLSFEDALAELERIVKGLEGGQQKLEDAIACYERGAAHQQLLAVPYL